MPRARGLTVAGALLVMWSTATGHVTPPISGSVLNSSSHASGASRQGLNASGVAVSGSLAFLATRATGLQILDVADPGRPQRLGLLMTRGEAV